MESNTNGDGGELQKSPMFAEWFKIKYAISETIDFDDCGFYGVCDVSGSDMIRIREIRE